MHRYILPVHRYIYRWTAKFTGAPVKYTGAPVIFSGGAVNFSGAPVLVMTLWQYRRTGIPLIDHRPIVAALKGNRPTIGRSSADDQPIVQFCDFLSKSVRIVFNVIASVGRQIEVYRPIKIQKSYRPTVFLMQSQHKYQSILIAHHLCQIFC